MIPVGDHGLTCLSGTDFAAIALLMQQNAEVIDGALQANLSSLQEYSNRPWAIATTTATTTVAQTTGEWPGTGFFSAISLLSNGYSQVGFGIDITSQTISPTLHPAGWYMMGGSATFQATGAVTANSRRDLAVEWAFPEGGITQYGEYSISSVYESNTAGDSASVAGMFFADGTRNYFYDLTWSHRNAASTMTANAGARFWIVYFGSGVTV